MGKFFRAFFFSLLILVHGGCKNEEPRVFPTVTTTTAYAVTDSSAILEGHITNDFEWHASKGICYSISPDPLIDIDPITPHRGVYILNADLFHSGFTFTLTGLHAGVTYYAKAFTVGGWMKTNPDMWRIVYGNEISFTTKLTK
jgi:hypothetical protein